MIAIDPPWPISKIIRASRPNQIENLDYNTIDLSLIKSLPVSSLSSDNSVCFLWTIQKYLPVSFSILESWGFKYQRCITWDKGNGMCLFGFHHRTEFILFGYRGKIKIYPKHKAFPTLITEHTFKQHSVKPNIFYEYASLFGDRCLDMFGRNKRDGWSIWGDEVESDIKLSLVNGEWVLI